jgi:uncharacterized membrane protein
VLTVLTAAGAGLVAGVFFAFSSFVMRALGRTTPARGVTAMQQINITVLRPPFMIVFLGTALLSVALVVLALIEWTEPSTPYLIAGGLLYLLGTFGVTVGYHVPRNNALAKLEADIPATAQYWPRFQREWVRANHLRTVAALAATVSFIVALRA